MDTEKSSPFSSQWRDCLAAHYIYMARNDTPETLSVLSDLMQSVGFRDSDLGGLYVKATMRMEDLPDGFVPNVPGGAFSATSMSPPVYAHPKECQCPGCVAVEVVPHDAEGQPLLLSSEDQ